MRTLCGNIQHRSSDESYDSGYVRQFVCMKVKAYLTLEMSCIAMILHVLGNLGVAA